MTNNGFDIFSHYLGENTVSRKLFCNPFRGDTSPSCRLKERSRNGSTIWTMVDYGDSSWCGDVFTIIAKTMKLNPQTDFRELLKTIDKDMNLFVMDEAPAGVHPVIRHAAVPTPSGPVDFKAVYQTFRRSEQSYWLRYGITESILARYEVKSVRSCKFIRSDNTSYSYYGSYLEPMYGYTFNNATGIKVYRPFSKTRFLYGGTLPHPYVFGWKQLPISGDYVIITGGEKDVMSLAVRGYSAIAFNSESAHISENTMEELSSRFKHILFLYDCDTTGKRESAKFVEKFQGKFSTQSIILPLSGTKKDKDISDFFRAGHSVHEFQELIDNVIYKD